MIAHGVRYVLAVVTVLLVGVAACVDGVTPDCSIPSVCAPIEGDPITTPDGGADATPDEDTGSPSTPDADASPTDAADGG